MKRLKVVLLILLIGLMFNSCKDELAPTSFNNDEPVVMEKSDNGAEIFRYLDYQYFDITDLEAGLRLFVGIKDMDLCSSDLELFSIKELLLPNKDPDLWDRFMIMVKNDSATAYIFAWPKPDEYPNNCVYFSSVLPIAAGNVKVLFRDNDVDAWARDVANANSGMIHAQGQLIGSDGEEYHLNAIYKYVWKGYYEPPDYIIPHIKFLKESSEIKLH